MLYFHHGSGLILVAGIYDLACGLAQSPLALHQAGIIIIAGFWAWKRGEMIAKGKC